jgi:hypothetical protein
LENIICISAIATVKGKYSKAAKLCKITYEEDVEQGVVTKLIWTRLGEKEKPAGEFFLRYSKEYLDEEQISDFHNLTREVESSFRYLKKPI